MRALPLTFIQMNPIPACIALLFALLLCVPWRLLRPRPASAAPPAIAQRAHLPGPRSHTDIRQLLHQMSESLRGRLQAAGMALELRLPGDPLQVLLDRSGMQEVLARVVELACRAMHAGSTLQVLGRIDGVHAVVNFIDAAPGLDEPRLARCFDAVAARSPRWRSDVDAIASVALCEQIVSEHRGRIYAAPSPLGSLGITLRLPLERAAAEAARLRA
jgi:two-component system sensor histidine kinase BaeS